MALTFNGLTKVITLTAGTTSVSVLNLWSRWVDWFLTSDNSKYLPAFVSVGGDDIDISTGTTIPIYAFLMNGWRIKPQEANHTLTVNEGILLVNGGGDPFNNTTGAYTVRINYQQPVQVIAMNTGGASGSAPTVEQIREEMDVNSVSLSQLLANTDDIPSKILDTNITSHQIVNSWGKFVVDMKRVMVNKATRSGNIITIYELDGVTVWKKYDLSNGGRVEL